MVIDVFISYARRDRDYVRELVSYLEENGYSVWFDDSIRRGDRWRDVISAALDTCRSLLIVMSVESGKSKWVSREHAYAEDRGIPVFTVLLDGDKPPFGFSDISYEDVRGGSMPSARFLRDLSSSLRSIDLPLVVPMKSQTPDARGKSASSMPPVLFDFRGDGLYMVGEWSPARMLYRAQLQTKLLHWEERAAQAWIDPLRWSSAVLSRTSDTGQIAYVSDFKIDHRESVSTEFCKVTFSESSYAEVRAIEQLRIDDPAVLASADRALVDSVRHYLNGAVPSSLAANVVVLCSNQELLCVRRSAAVDNGIGQWTVGIFETLKLADVQRAGDGEVFFRLVERALAEELSLYPGDFGEILITWLGIYQPILRGHLVAIVSTGLTKAELIARARRAHSSYEHDGFAWIPCDEAEAVEFTSAERAGTPGGAGGQIDVHGKTWVEQSRLAVVEAWRVLSE